MSATILIIDDEENARDNIGTFLASRGFETLSAGTLAEARQSLQRGNADVILLDVQLPDGYGPNLLEETTHLPMRPPIILITAYGDVDMAVEAMKNGAHDFLQKPIRLNQLEKSVRRAVEVAVDHAGQLEVVDIAALALDEADVLDALALAAHALQLLGALGAGRRHVVHSAASFTGAPASFAAAN